MSSSKTSSFSFYFLIFSLFLKTILGADPLFHFCSKSENFTFHDTYEQNLMTLTASLSFQTPALTYQTPSYGFGQVSIGQPPNTAYGLALCRGDVSSSNCRECVDKAGGEIRKLCPNNKGAVVWYDNCLFKYSNQAFFGKIDNQNRFYMWNVNNVTDPMSFNANTKNLLTKLAKEAVSDKKLFATGDMDIGYSTKLYGLVQCTRDLSSQTCGACLDEIIDEIPTCCDGKQGGRVIGGSCNFRYEIFPFVNKA